MQKGSPLTCRTLAGEPLLEVAEICEGLEALCAGRHPNLQALCYFLFLGGGGGQHQWLQRNPFQNLTKSHKTDPGHIHVYLKTHLFTPEKLYFTKIKNKKVGGNSQVGRGR